MMNFNENKGYIGTSRSIRSANAIDNYEVPLTYIDKCLIDDFLNCYETDFTEDAIRILKGLQVGFWKYCAKERGTDSWHHTGSYYNETDHYNLYKIAEYMLENLNVLKKEFKEFKDAEKLAKNIKKDYKFGIIRVQVWGGTRKHPKVIDYKTEVGIIVGDWLYYKTGHVIYKYKTSANKVTMLEEYDSYRDLKKKHKDIEKDKKYFNEIIKEKGLK